MSPAGPATYHAEISGLREQILGKLSCVRHEYSCNTIANRITAANAHVIYRTSNHEICIVCADYPESGYYGARLVRIQEHSLVLGTRWADSVVGALRQLLQESCEVLRDTLTLQNYRAT